MQNKSVIHDATNKCWLEYIDPVEIVQTTDLNEVISTLEYLEKRVNQDKLYAVGFISYDASPAFDYALKVIKSDNDFPLIWFGLYSSYNKIDIPTYSSNMTYCHDWQSTVNRDEYDKAIYAVKENIREGNTYQVNYTMRRNAQFSGDTWRFFCELAQSQKADYPAYIETDDFVICSASPELFFRYDNGNIVSKPMKGTAGRRHTTEDDIKEAVKLYHSNKNRAENLMIVDMIRNDLSRISEIGTVKVPALFDVEKYPTVWQMTSTVEANSKKSLTEILKALFPCASITGAPKAYTMKIIADLENTPRKVYTGAIGFITPDSKAQFNVAIRTVIIDKHKETAEYGVGGGITWDSTDSDEYNECIIKTKFLNQRQPQFSLLESLLWTNDDGFFLLDYHLQRLSSTAEYFEYKLNIDDVEQKLLEHAENLNSAACKVRLLVSHDSIITVESEEIEFPSETMSEIKVTLADEPINKNNPFLYHKTTNRTIYSHYKNRFPEYDEVILWNSDREITECTSSNIVIKKDGKLITPEIKSGLLAGTFRSYLLDNNEISERVVTVEDLMSSDEIYIINSVRKWRRAKINL
ncbi:MAG TPA: aminodeoxychorismate synthase component I [Victivallales bacterium]|nr:aminodeoxychorismate synthase component I [Victivallales bacterium]